MIPCAFCPQPAVKKGGEHAFSAWMDRIVDQIFPRQQRNIRMVNSGGRTANWKGASLDMRLPVVCTKCNNEWMSDLEQNHAIPAMKDLILSDKLVSLSPERLKSIADFAFKHAVVADYTSVPSREPFFSTAARHSFAATRAIPQGVYMWLAAFKEKGQGIFIPLYYDHKKGFEMYTLTFGMGHFLFQVLGFRWTSKKFTGFPGLTQNAVWNKFSIPFWPSNGHPITWPPNKQLIGGAAKEFTERWKTITFPAAWQE